MEESDDPSLHQNIRLLVHRMDTALGADDFAAVLHSSASIFETLAKEIVSLPTSPGSNIKEFL